MARFSRGQPLLDLFEFVVSFYVVIAGLGVTLLVRSIGQMIESRERVRFYWVHTSWLAVIFVLHVNSWFTLWAYRDQPSWTVGQLLLLLSVPILLYLASHVSVPEIAEGSPEEHDMELYYYERHRVLLGLLALSALFNLGCEYLLLKTGVLTIANWLRLAGLGILLIGVISARPRVHAAITFAVLALFAYGLGVLDNPIAD